MDPSIQRLLDQLNSPIMRTVTEEAQRIQAARERAISNASTNLSSVQKYLRSAQAQNPVATALIAREQALKGINPDVIQTASRIAQQVAQTRQGHVERAVRHIQAAGPASILDLAFQTLSSSQTRALIEQANSAPLSEYARALAETTLDEPIYEPTIEDSELDWVFELDEQSLRALCQLLIPVLDALQVVGGVCVVMNQGFDPESVLLLTNSVRILLAYALAALEEYDG
jgi:hypothetical protein